MAETLREKKPTLKAQIDFVRDARKLLVVNGMTITMTEEHIPMLRAIEENLCAVKLMDENNG